MGLGALPASDPHFLGMVGMHGFYEANMAMHDCDVMVAVGSRFDDRVTGRLNAFSPNSKKIHIDIDPSSINKNVRVDVPIVADCGAALAALIEGWAAAAPNRVVMGRAARGISEGGATGRDRRPRQGRTSRDFGCNKRGRARWEKPRWVRVSSVKF